MIMGIVAVAAAGDVVIANPTLQPTHAWTALIVGSPAFFLASNAGFRGVFCKRVPWFQLIVVVLLVAMAPLATVSSTLGLMTAATSVVIVLALWETRANRRLRNVLGRPPKVP
jgi:low temperature requirement protein LtrA